MKFLVLLVFILLIPILGYKCYNIYKAKKIEKFVSQISKSYDSNEFKQIVLDKLDNYDIEIAIPSGQYLYSSTQGNWGFSTDETNDGVVFGVYRDGYTADGSIFKGKSGKKYKYMLEQGPYVLRYEVRENKGEHDVSIYIDDKLVKIAKKDGVSSDKLKVIGTNYHNYNNIANGNERGRRPIDYLKFIPKNITTKTIEGFSDNNNSNSNSNNNNKNYYDISSEEDNEIIDERAKYNFMTRMCEEEGLFCNKIQKLNIDLKTGKIHYNLDELDSEKKNDVITDQETDHFFKQLFDTMDDDNDGFVSKFDMKSLMNEFYIRDDLYKKVLKSFRPEGIDFKTVSSIIGEPVKLVLKNIYEEHGLDGIKMTYKILGYEYVGEDLQEIAQKAKKKKQFEKYLKKAYPETNYDKSEPTKTRYRSDYKPQNPRPENGIHFYDSIWDFNKN
jgi:hypothetical protein